MKVKCIKIYNEITKTFQKSSSWLSIGNEYLVSEVSMRPEREILYRLQGDTNKELPAIYDARQFEVVTNTIPSNWIVIQECDGIITFTPANWSIPGFWENFFDGDQNAIESYRKELNIISNEENNK